MRKFPPLNFTDFLQHIGEFAKTDAFKQSELTDNTGEMSSEVIEVHDLTNRPTDYWRSWKKTANVMRLQVRQPNTAAPEDKVRTWPTSPHRWANYGMFSCGSCVCPTLTPSPLTSTFRYLTAMYSCTRETSPGPDIPPRCGSSIAG